MGAPRAVAVDVCPACSGDALLGAGAAAQSRELTGKVHGSAGDGSCPESRAQGRLQMEFLSCSAVGTLCCAGFGGPSGDCRALSHPSSSWLLTLPQPLQLSSAREFRAGGLRTVLLDGPLFPPGFLVRQTGVLLDI